MIFLLKQCCAVDELGRKSLLSQESAPPAQRGLCCTFWPPLSLKIFLQCHRLMDQRDQKLNHRGFSGNHREPSSSALSPAFSFPDGCRKYPTLSVSALQTSTSVPTPRSTRPRRRGLSTTRRRRPLKTQPRLPWRRQPPSRSTPSRGRP